MVAGKGVWQTNDVITAAGLNDGYDSSGNIKLSAGEKINDVNGNEIVEFTQTASAVNNVKIANAATGVAPSVNPSGEVGINMIVNKNEVITSNVQLTGSTADGFASTPTDVWNFANAASGDEVGLFGHTLTLSGTGTMGAGTDVLGVNRKNTFSGTNYLKSTSTDFNIGNTPDTDDLIYGGWFCIPDPTPAATVTLISNLATNDGYGIQLTTAGVLTGNIRNASAACSPATTISSVGWYHIIHVRDVGTANYLMVNGVLVGQDADLNVATAPAKFQISGDNGANDLAESGTIPDEIIFRKGTLPANWQDMIRNIYARSAKKFAVKSQDNSVVVPANSAPLQTSGGTTTFDVSSVTNTVTTFICGFKPKIINMSGCVGGTVGGAFWATYAGGQSNGLYTASTAGTTSYNNNFATFSIAAGSNTGVITITDYGFTLTWTKTSSPTGTAMIVWNAIG